MKLVYEEYHNRLGGSFEDGRKSVLPYNRFVKPPSSTYFNDNWIAGWKKKNFKGVKNVDLWKSLLTAMTPHKVEFIWVKGHAGHHYNERCDVLAKNAALGNSLEVDKNYESGQC